MKTPVADFPDWFGPMLVKELRQGLKTRGFVLSFVGLQVALVLVLIYHVLLYSRDPHGFDASGLGVVFWMLIGGLLLFVTPMRAFNELSSERRANTLELIFMSGLSAWRITFGKWVSLLFQALLFLLAVLPYAILRYYFGAVDLTEDLTYMLVVLMLCALLSAAALAVSGMPLWVRIIVGLIVAFNLTGIVPGILMFGVFRSMTGVGRSFTPSFGTLSWPLIAWDFILFCLVALHIGAATVAPLAENYAGRQRVLGLLLALPIPIMKMLKVDQAAIYGQLGLFVAVNGLLAWHHLSTRPAPLLSYCRPFRGWRAPLGIPFQPGWPSALVYYLLCVAVFGAVALPSMSSHQERQWFGAVWLMIAAILPCSTLAWVVLRKRAARPLIESTLFLLLCGLAMALISAGKPASIELSDFFGFGVLPPLAIWAMADPRGGIVEAEKWHAISLVAFVAYTAVLLLLSMPYWMHYFRLCRRGGRPVSAPATPPLPAP